ncbi:hypothetical protein ACO0LD_28970 [Undibacterium sp. Ji83W]|uniref:hypothetical protein n=1 Tax=Undibacterium sp. Ji83W TaxID=3413043 RepID=UPI003BF311DB
MEYEHILAALHVKQLNRLKDSNLRFGEILGLQIPFDDGFGFPPALIPIANSIGSFQYFGAFLYDIVEFKVSFVDLMIDESELFEIGLNEKQFCYYLARRSSQDYFEEDSDISIEISQLCTLLGVDELDNLQTIDEKNYLKLNVFKSGIPKYLQNRQCGTTYGKTGFDLASNGMKLNFDPNASFSAAISNCDYQKAWEALNSPGWLLEDAKISFKKLVDHTGNPLLTSLYDKWASLNHPQQGY